MSKHYGIIGNPLEHSFSSVYFTEKFLREKIDADYRLFPLASLQELERIAHLNGYNVTYPYKETILPYLSEIDLVAKEIGAVNVVHGTRGYNTDYIGFMEAIRPLLRPTDNKALILGTGGAAKAIHYALRQMNIEPAYVSRDKRKGILYQELTQEIIAGNSLIIQCTPLGMFPDCDAFPPIPYQYLTKRHLLFDCIYNPTETEFMKRGAAYGAQVENGLNMLQLQAEAAWRIWSTK
ncbi:MAG: shikimate dehydrogenase [Paludibacteraceae bacterium]|nr:shikimate dehydrogenase [Paludibacteraceae bacterium]